MEQMVKGYLDEFAEEKKSTDQIYAHKSKMEENDVTLNQIEEEI